MARKKTPQLSKPKRRATGPREKFAASGSDESKFTVLIDSGEQDPRQFIKTPYCNGTTTANLLWGDYSLEGFQDKFTIERKGSVAEFYNNICTKDFERFEKELIALRDYPDAFIVCEFSFADIINFPSSAKLPSAVKRKLAHKAPYFLRRTLELMIEYKIPFIFTGNEANARTTMISIFKRIWEKYSP